MKNTILIIVLAVVALSIILVSQNLPKSTETKSVLPVVQNTEVREGTQYITVNASGGYTPAITNALPGIPTKLIMSTNSTYDCSAALRIRAVDYSGILPATGKTEIDLGIPDAGEKIIGVCSMGMYSFEIQF